MIASFYRKLLARRAELEESVFLHPPADWLEYQKRLGAWTEIDGLIIELKPIIEGKEDE